MCLSSFMHTRISLIMGPHYNPIHTQLHLPFLKIQIDSQWYAIPVPHNESLLTRVPINPMHTQVSTICR